MRSTSRSVDVSIGIDPVRDAREVVPRPDILPRKEDAVIARVASAIRTSPGPLAIGRLGRHAGWRSFGCRLYRIAGLSRPLQIDQNICAVDPDWIGPQVFDGGFTECLAGANVEPRLMQGALDGAVLHPAGGEQAGCMRTHAGGRVDHFADTVERDRRALDIDPDHIAIAERVARASFRHAMPGQSFRSTDARREVHFTHAPMLATDIGRWRRPAAHSTSLTIARPFRALGKPP